MEPEVSILFSPEPVTYAVQENALSCKMRANVSQKDAYRKCVT
jgi:hypothetical protein